MNKKLGRLLRPGVGMYFVVMALFCGAALFADHYWLAAAESAVTLMVFTIYMVSRNYRNRQRQKYIQSTSNTLESMGRGESPFPAVLVRLGDSGQMRAKIGAVNSAMAKLRQWGEIGGLLDVTTPITPKYRPED